MRMIYICHRRLSRNISSLIEQAVGTDREDIIGTVFVGHRQAPDTSLKQIAATIAFEKDERRERFINELRQTGVPE